MACRTVFVLVLSSKRRRKPTSGRDTSDLKTEDIFTCRHQSQLFFHGCYQHAYCSSAHIPFLSIHRPVHVAEDIAPETGGQTPFDLELPDVKKDRHKSLKCILFSNFLSATGFSILLSTMWPYLREQTDPSYKKDLGYVVAAFSVGQVIGAPFWGNYCVKRPYAETMHLTIVMRLLGNLLYFFITVLPLGHAGKVIL